MNISSMSLNSINNEEKNIKLGELSQSHFLLTCKMQVNFISWIFWVMFSVNTTVKLLYPLLIDIYFFYYVEKLFIYNLANPHTDVHMLISGKYIQVHTNFDTNISNMFSAIRSPPSAILHFFYMPYFWLMHFINPFNLQEKAIQTSQECDKNICECVLKFIAKLYFMKCVKFFRLLK